VLRAWLPISLVVAPLKLALSLAIRTISELLGHGTIQMTTRCAHLSPDVGQEAVARLDEPARGPTRDRCEVSEK
jgi:hypothetical protein